jgi:large subunit ribosomal protein L15
VTSASLLAAGVISAPLGGVRLLGKGEIKAKLNFEVYHATAGAVAAIEKAGGTVKMLKPVEPEAVAK